MASFVKHDITKITKDSDMKMEDLNSLGKSARIPEVFRLKKSLLNKTGFHYRDTDGSLRSSPDNRERVWKLWSRIIEGLEELAPRKSNAFTDIKRWMASSRHFVLPRKTDTWNGSTYQQAVRQRNGKEIPQVEWMDMIRSMFHTFVLPFKVCAIHLPGEAIAVITRLKDTDDCVANPGLVIEDDTSTSGLAGTWMFFIMHPNREPAEWVGDTGAYSHSSFCFGCINQHEEALHESEEGDPLSFAVLPLVRWDLMSNGSVVLAWHEGDDDAVEAPTNPKDTLGDTAQAVFDLLIAIQSHKRFIVRVNQKKKKQNKKAKRKQSIPLISERPVYLSLEPQEIREQFGIPNPDGSKRRSHERRAHLRELRSEKFTFKRGQIVPVKGSWVGPASGTTNDGREYRVLIDKASPHVAGKGR